MNTATTDLADFGFREIKEASRLLSAWVNNGLPDDFENEDVHLMFNKNSGNVFLTNSEFQVAMESGGKLYSFYYCSNCGHEGCKEEGFGKSICLCDECFSEEEESERQ